jgi:hypothetical protein
MEVRSTISRQKDNRPLLVRLIKMPSDMPLEFLYEQWSTLCPPALMTNGVLNLDFRKDSAVVERDEEGVTDGPFGGFVIVHGEAVILDTKDLGAECVDTRVGGRLVCAVQR